MLRPLYDRVVVRRVDEETVTRGGIIIPEVAREKPQRGVVMAVGDGARRDDGSFSPPIVKAGDVVLFGKWSGAEVDMNGVAVLIMLEHDILGIVDDDGA